MNFLKNLGPAFIAALILIASGCNAQQSASDSEGDGGPASRIQSVSPGADSRISNYQDLKTTIQNQNISRLEDVLPLLSDTLLSNFTLMYQSRSVQGATPSAPRAILYGADSSLILSFNGSSSESNFDVLEAIQFDTIQSAFKFYQIDFSPGTTGGRPIFSEENPQVCLQCHTQDPRPNWEAYDVWPGAYAGLDDVPQVGDSLEFSNLNSFISSVSADARYKWLTGLASGYSAPKPGQRSHISRNSLLSMEITDLNFKRVTRIMRDKPYYQGMKYAILGSFWCNRSFRDFFPTSMQDEIPATLTTLGNPNYAHVNMDILQFLYPDYDVIREWTTAFLPRGTISGFQTPGNAEMEFTGKLVDGDADLRAYFILGSDQLLNVTRSLGTLNSSVAGADCENLVQASKSAITAAPTVRAFLTSTALRTPAPLKPMGPLATPLAVTSCIRCHVSGAAPAIPFDDLSRLRPLLNEPLGDDPTQTLLQEIVGRVQSGSMPKGAPLTRDQKDSLIEYFSAVDSGK